MSPESRQHHGMLTKPDLPCDKYASVTVWSTSFPTCTSAVYSHSCIPSVCSFTQHNTIAEYMTLHSPQHMMIVRAAKDIDSDTEITFWYQVPTGHDSKKMQGKLLCSWQFTCNCAICQDAEQTRATVLTERQKLLKRLKGVFHVGESQKLKIVEVERLLKALSETYSHPADKGSPSPVMGSAAIGDAIVQSAG
jgi:hypothetical protein